MKRLFLSLLAFVLTVTAGQAQRLVIGEKTPEIRVSEWLNGSTPNLNGKAILVDFFHSSNDQCVANLGKLNSLQSAYGSRMNIVIVSREGMDKVKPFVDGKGYGFYAGTDDGGKTFTAYGVRFVPFAVLIDSKGRLAWTGNVANLTPDIIDKALK